VKVRVDYLSLVLLSVLIFQISVIPDTLNIKPLARLINALVLLVLSMFLIFTINNKREKPILLYYSLPVLLVVCGYSINFILALSDSSLGQAGKLLPWIGALTIPFFKKIDVEKSWKVFYIFMFWSVLISLVEYFAIFGGVLTPTRIETDRGVFFKGIFSILHYLDGGIPYFRFYGVFAEPGTTAMFLIPALVYSLMYSKKIAICIFLLAMSLTVSLGGYFSLMITFYLFFSWKAGNMKYAKVGKSVLTLLVVLFGLISIGEFTRQYEKKQLSASVREDNVSNFLGNIGDIVMDKPFGFILEGKSLSELEGENENYVGSNFSFFVAFAQGGILSFLGYTLFFFTNVVVLIKYNIQKQDPDKILACAMISLPALLIYCFQRTTMLETMLYAFLFSVPIFRVLSGKDSKVKINN